jgi:hypothetical protein
MCPFLLPDINMILPQTLIFYTFFQLLVFFMKVTPVYVQAEAYISTT